MHAGQRCLLPARFPSRTVVSASVRQQRPSSTSRARACGCGKTLRGKRVDATDARMAEEWREISEAPGYEVSDRGRVRSWRGCNGTHRKRPRLRKLVPDKRGGDRGGYLNVMYLVDAKHVLRKVHHLVLDAFVGKRPEGQECRHKNGNTQDNRLSNLAWGTPAQNQKDKIAHGTSQHGERNHMAKLTNAQADEIRKSKELLKVLAQRYEVTMSTISRIRNGFSRRG